MTEKPFLQALVLALIALALLPAAKPPTAAADAGRAPPTITLYPGGTIQGRVTSGGAPVYAAHIVLLDPDNESVAETYSGLNGEYAVTLPPSAAPGEYRLVVEKHGYAAAEIRVNVEPDPRSVAVLGGRLAPLLRRIGFNATHYTLENFTALIRNLAYYRSIIIDTVPRDPGAYRVIALVRKLLETNTTTLFLGNGDPGSWTGLYMIYAYRDRLSLYNIPLPEKYAPTSGEAVLWVKQPTNPVFYIINYTANPENHTLYITRPGENASYAEIELEGAEALAYINTSSTASPAVSIWRNNGHTWYYIAVGASGSTSYSWGVRQIIINTIAQALGYHASITGRVVNSTGEPLPETEIKILGTNITLRTAQNGSFTADNLPPSIYTLRVRHEGYLEKQVTIALPANRAENITIRLLSPNDRGWLILVYLDGDNNLEDAAIDDMNEMETVGSGESYTILVLFDRIPGYDDSNGDWTGTRLYRVLRDNDPYNINSEQIPLWTGDMEKELNMGDNETLYNFIKYAYQLYPAVHVALILWDHGSGFKARSGVGVNNVAYDDTDGDSLDEPEIRATLRRLYVEDGIRVNLVAFDACLMGMYEVAYEIAGYSDVVAFSEETEPWDGYPYDILLSYVAQDPYMDPEQLGYYIVEAYSEGYSGSSDLTLSSLRLSVVENVAQQLDEIAGYMKDNMASLVSDISAAKSSAQSYYYSDYLDLYDFLYKLRQQTSDTVLQDMITLFLNTFQEAVINEWHTGDLPGSHGATIWMPSPMAWNSYKDRYLALRFARDTQWDEMIQEYLGQGGTSLGAINSLSPAAPGAVGNTAIIDVELEPLSIAAFLIINTPAPCFVTVETETYIEHYYVSSNTSQIPLLPYNSLVHIYGVGVEPAVFTITPSPGQVYGITLSNHTIHAALIGGTDAMKQALERRGLRIDMVNYTGGWINMSLYDVVIVADLPENTSQEQVINLYAAAYAFNKSIIILDSPMGGAGETIYSYAQEVLGAGYPAPFERTVEPGTQPYMIIEKPHPALPGYAPRTPQKLSTRGIGTVYYRGINTTSRTRRVETVAYAATSLGAIKGAAVTLALLDNNSTYIAYIGFGSPRGDEYSAEDYTGAAADAVAGVAAYTASTGKTAVPVPVPEPLGYAAYAASATILILAAALLGAYRRRSVS